MGFFQPWTWRRKVVWDYVDWVFLGFAAGSGAVAAVIADPKDKALPAGMAVGFTILAGYAKVRYRRNDEREKDEATQARDASEEEERTTRNAEIEALRARYSGQARRMLKVLTTE